LHSMMTRIYKVAGHTFAISGRVELFEQMDNLESYMVIRLRETTYLNLGIHCF